ncbi:MAG: Maf family nucleotide pyrophosphatase [Proteobacteria bacterium]|nr:Maf family nucleotide pyrophosphatase [Pseudomonadota bacterium]
MGTPVRRPAPAPLILASASPRRLSLLEQIGIRPAAVERPCVDETPHTGEGPVTLARRLAVAKVLAIAPSRPGCFILAADTVVAVGRRLLPKAEVELDARRCLTLLSGRRHRVIGGIALLSPDGRLRVRMVETKVALKRLETDEIDRYLASCEWHGKAGGYAIQGRAAAFIRWINGSYSNVVGLALFETSQLLTGAGAIDGRPECVPDDADA